MPMPTHKEMFNSRLDQLMDRFEDAMDRKPGPAEYDELVKDAMEYADSYIEARADYLRDCAKDERIS
jgi:hypothetical protein